MARWKQPLDPRGFEFNVSVPRFPLHSIDLRLTAQSIDSHLGHLNSVVASRAPQPATRAVRSEAQRQRDRGDRRTAEARRQLRARNALVRAIWQQAWRASAAERIQRAWQRRLQHIRSERLKRCRFVDRTCTPERLQACPRVRMEYEMPDELMLQQYFQKYASK